MINKTKSIIVSWTSVLVWMTIIFLLSAQPASVSGANSTSIVVFMIETAHKIGMPVNSTTEDPVLLEQLDHLLRKTTHAMVYLILALLLVNALKVSGIKGKKLYTAAFLLCILYAGTDEFHQLFVPGRGAMLSDIMIDSLGGVVGLLVYSFPSCHKKHKYIEGKN